MKKIKNENKKFSIARNPTEIAEVLGIDSPADQAMMLYKAQLSSLAVRAIKKSQLSVNEIVARSGVARSKVSAIKNGALMGISCDLFFKVISAAGAKINLKMAS